MTKSYALLYHTTVKPIYSCIISNYLRFTNTISETMIAPMVTAAAADVAIGIYARLSFTSERNTVYPIHA